MAWPPVDLPRGVQAPHPEFLQASHRLIDAARTVLLPSNSPSALNLLMITGDSIVVHGRIPRLLHDVVETESCVFMVRDTPQPVNRDLVDPGAAMAVPDPCYDVPQGTLPPLASRLIVWGVPLVHSDAGEFDESHGFFFVHPDDHRFCMCALHPKGQQLIVFTDAIPAEILQHPYPLRGSVDLREMERVFHSLVHSHSTRSAQEPPLLAAQATHTLEDLHSLWREGLGIASCVAEPWQRLLIETSQDPSRDLQVLDRFLPSPRQLVNAGSAREVAELLEKSGWPRVCIVPEIFRTANACDGPSYLLVPVEPLPVLRPEDEPPPTNADEVVDWILRLGPPPPIAPGMPVPELPPGVTSEWVQYAWGYVQSQLHGHQTASQNLVTALETNIGELSDHNKFMNTLLAQWPVATPDSMSPDDGDLAFEPPPLRIRS